MSFKRTILDQKIKELYKEIINCISLHKFDVAYDLIDDFKDKNYVSLIDDNRIDQLVKQVDLAKKEYRRELEIKNCDPKKLIDYIYDGKNFDLEILDYALEKMKNEHLNYSSDIIRIISLPKINQFYKFEAVVLMKKYQIKFDSFFLKNKIGKTIFIEYDKVDPCWLDFEDMPQCYYKKVYDEINIILFKEPSLINLCKYFLTIMMQGNFGIPEEIDSKLFAKSIVDLMTNEFNKSYFKN